VNYEFFEQFFELSTHKYCVKNITVNSATQPSHVLQNRFLNLKSLIYRYFYKDALSQYLLTFVLRGNI